MKTPDLSEALFRRRMAITQADALIRQAETNIVTLLTADKSPDLRAFGDLIRQQSVTLMRAADHILTQQVVEA